MKKKTMMCIAAVMCLCSSMTVYAAPETMPDGTVFDAEYYAQTYPDVAAVLGTDRDILYNHYVTFGKSEGRLPYEPGSAQTVEPLAPAVKKVSCKTFEEVLAFYSHFGRYPEFMLTDSRPVREQYWLLTKEDSSKIWKGATFAYLYDKEGNLIGREDSDHNSYTYDSQGRPIYYEYHYGLSHCNFNYDEQGRLKEIVEDDVEHIKFKYDDSGLLINIKDSSSFSDNMGYDEQEKLIWKTDAKNYLRWTYDYDEFGRLIKITEFDDNPETPGVYEFFFSYDDQGRMISKIEINSYTEKYRKIDYVYE